MLAVIYNEVLNAGSKSKMQEFTTSGTFTAPFAGAYTFVLQGASGGSGGCAGTARSGGSGAGQTIRRTIFLTQGQVVTITIGAAGVGGSTTPTNGTDGGATTITVGAVVYTARGGLGSLLANGTNTVGARGGQTIPDTTAGRNSVLIAGDTFEGANGASGNTAISGGGCGSFSGGTSPGAGGGGGGASFFGAGGNGGASFGTAGTTGAGFGAGAGGSFSTGGVTGQPGVVQVTWTGP